jgi:hypothetical protein
MERCVVRDGTDCDVKFYSVIYKFKDFLTTTLQFNILCTAESYFAHNLYCRVTAKRIAVECHVCTTLEDCNNSDAVVLKRLVQHSNEEWHQFCYYSPAGSESHCVCVLLTIVIPAHFKRFAPSINQYRCVTSSFFLHFA